MIQKSSKFDEKPDKFKFWLKIWQKSLENGKNLNLDLKKQEKVIKLRKKLIILAIFHISSLFFGVLECYNRDDGAL